MFLVPIEVECYAGHRTSERPRAFQWMRRRIEVVEILDRWYEGGVDPTRSVQDYFQVEGTDGDEYLLKHDRSSDEWYLCVRME